MRDVRVPALKPNLILASSESTTFDHIHSLALPTDHIVSVMMVIPQVVSHTSIDPRYSFKQLLGFEGLDKSKEGGKIAITLRQPAVNLGQGKGQGCFFQQFDYGSAHGGDSEPLFSQPGFCLIGLGHHRRYHVVEVVAE